MCETPFETEPLSAFEGAAWERVRPWTLLEITGYCYAAGRLSDGFPTMLKAIEEGYTGSRAAWRVVMQVASAAYADGERQEERETDSEWQPTVWETIG